MDDNEGMTFADMIIISGQRYIDEMEQRIAALEAQNAKLRHFVLELTTWQPDPTNEAEAKMVWNWHTKAFALLAELDAAAEGGGDG